MKLATKSTGVTVTGVCATTLYGDGSNLTGTGFSADVDQNLIAVVLLGSYDPSSGSACYNIFLMFTAMLLLLVTRIFSLALSGQDTTEGSNNTFLGNWPDIVTPLI